jgi:hypothetical protein
MHKIPEFIWRPGQGDITQLNKSSSNLPIEISEAHKELPKPIQLLAHALERIHGRVIPRRERKGIQLYMACPSCLAKEGSKALSTRKLAVNAELALALGRFTHLQGSNQCDYAGLCMKEQVKFRVSDLKSMPPLEQRGFKVSGPRGVSKLGGGRCLVQDEKGNTIPDHPGEVISLLDLPAYHPAIEYLKNRNYDIQTLVNQFRAGFCVKEAPEDKDKDRWYRKLSDGFKDTPQSRIIFYGDMLGVQRGWQARVLDKVQNDVKFYLHPYRNEWAPVEYKIEGKWKTLPHIENWGISKYKTAFSCERNSMLMGLDAAIKWNANRPGKKRIIVVTEGPLDAGRFGPPGCALLGKYFSDNQSRLAMTYADVVIYAGQNDEVGRKAEQDAARQFVGRCTYAGIFPPMNIKDFGELHTFQAWDILFRQLNILNVEL